MGGEVGVTEQLGGVLNACARRQPSNNTPRSRLLAKRRNDARGSCPLCSAQHKMQLTCSPPHPRCQSAPLPAHRCSQFPPAATVGQAASGVATSGMRPMKWAASSAGGLHTCLGPGNLRLASHHACSALKAQQPRQPRHPGLASRKAFCTPSIPCTPCPCRPARPCPPRRAPPPLRPRPPHPLCCSHHGS